MSKYCIFCSSSEVIKKGKQSGRQKYFCKNCRKNFQSKPQKSRQKDSVINQLTFKKTTMI
jgi:transposase-like protein